MYIFWQSNPPHVNSLGFTQKCKKHTFLTGARSLSFFFLPMSTLPIAWSTAYGCFWYTHWHGFGMQNHVEVSFCIHESWFMNHKRRKTKEKKIYERIWQWIHECWSDVTRTNGSSKDDTKSFSSQVWHIYMVRGGDIVWIIIDIFPKHLNIIFSPLPFHSYCRRRYCYCCCCYTVVGNTSASINFNINKYANFW